MTTQLRLPVAFVLGLAVTAAAQSPTTFAPEADFLRDNVFGQMKWKELGPVAFGGRIVDFAVHPKNPSVFWVAAASGGLWKTTNRGISFTPQFQDAYSISIGDIAVAESNGDVLYVGTGEANNQRSSYWGNGVYRSSDGGKTFTHVGLDGTDHIGRIAVHPKDADLVYVAALGSLYKANDDRGLYRSKDGGKSWTRIRQLSADVGFVDVLLDPQDPKVVYAASYERRRRAWNLTEGGEGSRLWKSTDGGDTWQQLGGGLPGGSLGRIGLDLCRRDSRILYATIENLNPAAADAGSAPTNEGEAEKKDAEPLPSAEELADATAMLAREAEAAEAQDPARRPRARIQGGEVWRSDDAGATWRKTNKTPIGGNPGYYYGQIRVDPSDPDTVYVLSVQCYRSQDGGKTWSAPAAATAGDGQGRRGGRGGRGGPGGGGADDFARSLHSDHHALWIDPADGKHALLGNDGGLGITYDGGRTWDYVARLPIAQYYAIGLDTRTDYRIFGGLQDNGSWGFPVTPKDSSGLAASDAFRINGGDGFYCVVDPEDPDLVYSESQFGGASRRNLRTGETRGIRPPAEKGSPALRSNWMTPIVLSPHNSATVYFGTQFLHRSLDRGNTWTTISGDLTTNDPDKKKGNVPHCTITTIAESPKAAGWLWVGTDDGKVWSSKDGGGRWTDLTDRFPPAVQHLWVSRVECSPHAAGTALVAFTGYREDRREPLLFRSDDGGETFRSIAGDLPMEPINVVRCHPRNAHCLLVGTEMGLYVSVNDGGDWCRLGTGLPRSAVHDLVVHARLPHVVAGTHGRGIWVLDATALEVLDEGALAEDFRVLPPSDGAMLRRAFSQGSVGARTWSAPAPFTAPTFRWYLRADTDAKVKVEVLDASGRVLWTQDGGNKSGYHEVAWAPQGGGRRGGPGGQGGQGGQGGPGQAPATGAPPTGQPTTQTQPNPQAQPGAQPTPPAQGEGGARGGQRGGRRGGQAQEGQGNPLQDLAQGFQNFGQGGRGGGGMRPGQYAVRISLGERSTTLPFAIRDLRGPRAASAVPGLGDLGAAAEEGEELSEEELEERLEAEAAEQAAGQGRGR